MLVYWVKSVIDKVEEMGHIFWLVENVASMALENLKIIDQIFGCDHEEVEAGIYGPFYRSRIYWSNYSPCVWDHGTVLSLQDVLQSNYNREAVVTKLNTVTTQTNSLRIGK